MYEIKTLREVCDSLDVTRRAVQGYEKAGLVSASGRNKYGHLLYNGVAQERIARIRFYQNLGFSIREIAELMDAPELVVKEALSKRVAGLQEEQKVKDALIRKAQELIGML